MIEKYVSRAISLTFTDPKRDPRYRAITLGYMSIGTYHDIKQYSQYWEVAFHSVRKLQKWHLTIERLWRQHIQFWDINYLTQILHSSSAKAFTLAQLQDVYDAILFWQNQIQVKLPQIYRQSMNCEIHWEKEINVSHRPAFLYEFVHKDVRVEDYGF